MWQELEYEFERFLEDMKQNETFCKYIDEDEYEDDYSHNEIGKCQDRFIHRAEKWLHENKPGQYIITSGWCVFVMSIDEARKRNLINWESRVVN